MAELETYCLCKCPICGVSFHEWIELYIPSCSIANVWCSRCSRCVSARVIPADLRYRY